MHAQTQRRHNAHCTGGTGSLTALVTLGDKAKMPKGMINAPFNDEGAVNPDSLHVALRNDAKLLPKPGEAGFPASRDFIFISRVSNYQGVL